VQAIEPLNIEEGAIADDPSGPEPTAKEVRRSARDRERMRIAMQNFARMAGDYDQSPPLRPPDVDSGRRVRRPSRRQLRQHREAMERFALQFQQGEVGDSPTPQEQDHPDLFVGTPPTNPDDRDLWS
jgi:hypothetical protein